MAFIGKSGTRISYDASALIVELKSDIAEFGEDYPVFVITQQRDGVTIYKDYEGASAPFDIPLNDGESYTKMTAGTLLPLYIQENALL